MTHENRHLGQLIFPLSGWIEGFILSVEAANRSPRTVQFYRGHLRNFAWWADQQGYRELAALEPRALRLFIRYLQTTDERWASDWHRSKVALSPSSVHGYVRSLKAFCTWLVEEGELEETPFRKVKTPSVPKRQPVPLTDEELQALLAACPRNELAGVRDAALILVLLDTGLRLSEVLRIQPDSITPTGSLRIIGKGDKERTVQVGTKARRALSRYRSHRQDSLPCMWVGKAGPLGIEGVSKILKRRSREAGIRPVNPHLLRHTFAVRWVRSGGDLFTLQRLLGHTTLQMVSRYVNLADADLADKHRRHSPADGLKW